ncbi:MAG: undecaprenyl-phosphate glucose phosphotransferase [Betaproteobacteria bacterium]|nr:undecaprenyl-phosphate glucose phosphotransferase [Betaproteobacteria bacterium]
MLDPAVALATLVSSAVAFDAPFDGRYVILALLVFSFTFPGRAPSRFNGWSAARDIIGYWAAIVVLLLLLGSATHTLHVFDQRALLTWVGATPIALFAAHRLAPDILPRMLAAEGLQRVAVIAGADELGRRLAEQIRTTPFLGIRLIGYFDDRGPGRIGNPAAGAVLGSLGELANYVKSHHVDLIYITLPMVSQPRILKLLDELCDTTASIYFTPDIFLFDLIQARMDTVGEMPVVAVCETPFYGFSGLVKRASDLALASAILLLIAPIMLAVAIGVKLTSPGPVFFRQRRYGLDGREIIVYKFRTMTVIEDSGVIRQATRDDPRVTPFGAFLRRTSLDELPQFINVLQGRMSVVGPRPHAVAHNELYRKLIKSYMIRHKVKPGITGLAQVHGLRGETDTLEKMKARIEYDLAYLRNWSLRLDLQIVWKTIFVVLKKQNAY